MPLGFAFDIRPARNKNKAGVKIIFHVNFINNSHKRATHGDIAESIAAQGEVSLAE